ncbi:MAG: hypothetical protein SFU98_06325 [Leptospiraceae bacterium]|nr:hypothetical protein [Leptospiraceae bacterium]
MIHKITIAFMFLIFFELIGEDHFRLTKFEDKYCELRYYSPKTTDFYDIDGKAYYYQFSCKFSNKKDKIGRSGAIINIGIITDISEIKKLPEEQRKLYKILKKSYNNCYLVQGFIYGKNFLKDPVDKKKFYTFYDSFGKYISENELCKGNKF